MKINVLPALANDIEALLKLAKEIGATVRVTDGGKTVYIQLGHKTPLTPSAT